MHFLSYQQLLVGFNEACAINFQKKKKIMVARSLDVMYTLLYLKWITDKFYDTWNFAQCYVTAWMAELFGGDWIYVYLYVWLSSFIVLLKLSQHC